MAAVARRLYNVSWTNDNCSFELPDIDATTTDNLFWTYTTNYSVGVVGVLAALALSGVFGAVAKAMDQRYKWRAVAFFGLTGIGYLIAGLVHEFFYHPTGPHESAHELMEKLSYTFVLLGNAALGLIGILALVSEFTRLHPYEVYLNSLVLIVNLYAAVDLWRNIHAGLNLVGVACIVTDVALGLIWLLRSCMLRDAKLFLRAFSVWMMVGGFAVQFLLRTHCGDDSYAHPELSSGCWRECPLRPLMYDTQHPFNHNALYHSIYCAALILLALLFCCSPESVTKSRWVLETSAKAPANGMSSA